ncbi:hypothetical protein RB2501_05350 [Robiginitalea biformata HTCC2501]|uniref:DUF2178 domain-containing protein n=2 Tax=Robiginitalea TaxID=252306 RepID=A4CH90_ROBBH|nr:hypothetical protein RB2501_05350 [Robiginitalea biformata HTCC2501]
MQTIDMNQTTRKQQLRNLGAWTFAWVLSTALVVFGAEFIWDGNPWITIVALAVNILVGIGMILSNRRLLENCDELEKKIQLESMGLTLGLTLVVGIAFSMMDATNLIPFDAEIAFLVMFMGICYMLAIWFNNRRYR